MITIQNNGRVPTPAKAEVTIGIPCVTNPSFSLDSIPPGGTDTAQSGDIGVPCTAVGANGEAGGAFDRNYNVTVTVRCVSITNPTTYGEFRSGSI